MTEIEKIKKDGAMTALVARFEELSDEVHEKWQSVDLDTFEGVKSETLTIINLMSELANAIDEIQADGEDAE